MGARLPSALSSSSSFCLLRRGLHVTRHSFADAAAVGRRYSAGSAEGIGCGIDDDGIDADGGHAGTRRRYCRGPHGEQDSALAMRKREQAAETALRAALGPGVDFPGSQKEPPQVYAKLSDALDVPPTSAELVKWLVNAPLHQTDMNLWSELVQSRQRHDGLAGVMAVWQGMRDNGIDLPTTGQAAHILWTTFITSGVTKQSSSVPNKLFHEVLQYAARLKDRSGAVYPRLYQTAMTTWLRVHPPLVKKWHDYLAEHIGEDCVDIKALAKEFALSNAFQPFKSIYLEKGNRHRVYDHFIPQLLMFQGIDKTLRWHRMFLANGDGPGAEAFALPLVQQLFDRDNDKSLPMVHKLSVHNRDFVVPKDGVSIDFPALTRATMSTLVGEVHGIKRREVGDSFVAKMFATRAFPIDMVINGLGIIGVEMIGPLALRELAMRVDSALDFSSKLNTLRRMGVEEPDSAYGRLLIKLAESGQPGLFEALLSSDQHPEAFEDVQTQEALLGTFLEQDDLSQIHVTLTGLSLRSGVAQSRAWNRILQHYIKQHEYRLVSDTLQQMQALNIVPTKRTLTFMHRHLLPRRRAGQAPPEAMPVGNYGVPPLQFTTQIYMYSAENGVRVNPKLWIENMKRYGMLQKWDELERLVLWLVTFYHDWNKAIYSQTAERRFNITLHSLFSTSMRDALIVWGFRYAVKRKLLFEVDPAQSLGCQPWARGVLLLKTLNNKGLHNHDMQTSPAFVRRVIKLRMWILFGPAYSTKRLNLEARKHNHLPLAHYLQHANAIWDGELFDFDSRLYEPENQPKLLLALFGRKARVGQKAGDRADVVAYAQALAQGRLPQQTFHRSGYRRQYGWLTSPFRIPEEVGAQRIPTWRSRRQRQRLSARSSSSRLVPSRQDTLEPA